MYDQNNVFAKILRGEIPCNKVYEDDYALCFNDLNPKATVHILVIPKGPYVNLLDFQMNATPAQQAGFWNAVKAVTADHASYQCIANTGAPYQEVFHFHLHILANK